MLNEYEDLQLECMEIDPDRMGHCNPLKDFNSPQDRRDSLIYLSFLIVGCFIVAFIIMKILSKRAH
jgi:hypothetical protein